MANIKNILFILFLFFVSYLKGQQILGSNLIQNSSFEQYYSCPCSEGELYKCKFWKGLSTDYFNICAPMLCPTSYPSNFAGFQYAHTGNAYAGAIIYENDWRKYRETIKTIIIDTLITDKRYCTNFYISLGSVSYSWYSTSYALLDTIGMLFSNDSIYDTVTPILNYSIKVQNSISHIDTISWFKMSNNFIAKGGEKFLAIGNFENNVIYPNNNPALTYVLIDDVSVCECIFEFNLGKDTTLCEGETIILNPNMPNAIYTWQDSSHAANYAVTKPGIYWVRAYFSDYGITTSDTIEITNCNPINIPNAFTPNGDGKNDVFKIETIKEIIDFKLIIYNRWGELIFESTDINKGWDGTFKNKIVPLGVYVYIVTGTIKDTGEQVKRTGSVTVVR